MLNVGIITQVRMTSTRLPGKVLKYANNQSLLQHHIDRLRHAECEIIVATTTNKDDDPIEEFCKKNALKLFRGSEGHVLSRFYLAAVENKLDIIVRVTSDCPLIDGHILKQAITEHLEAKNINLYTSNVLERSFPRGLDFEIFSFNRLKTAYEQATADFQIEHVTPFINRNADGLTEYKHITTSLNRSDWRLTVDTPEDFELIKILIEVHKANELNYEQLVEVLDANSSLKLLNQHIEQKKI